MKRDIFSKHVKKNIFFFCTKTNFRPMIRGQPNLSDVHYYIRNILTRRSTEAS